MGQVGKRTFPYVACKLGVVHAEDGNGENGSRSPRSKGTAALSELDELKQRAFKSERVREEYGRLFTTPTPSEILAARKRLGLTRKEAAAVIYKGEAMWCRWESLDWPMSPANWELFMLKTGMEKLI